MQSCFDLYCELTHKKFSEVKLTIKSADFKHVAIERWEEESA